jgi:hypothetical protein
VWNVKGVLDTAEIEETTLGKHGPNGRSAHSFREKVGWISLNDLQAKGRIDSKLYSVKAACDSLRTGRTR